MEYVINNLYEGDLNTLSTSFVIANEYTANKPTTSWFAVETIRYADTGAQIAHPLNGTKEYKRFLNAGTWSQWTT